MMGTLGLNDWRWWLFNYRSPVFHDLFGTPPVKQCFIIRGYDWKFWVMFESLEHEHHAKPSSKFSWLSCLWFPSVSPRTSAKKDNLAGKGQPSNYQPCGPWKEQNYSKNNGPKLASRGELRWPPAVCHTKAQPRLRPSSITAELIFLFGLRIAFSVGWVAFVHWCT